MSAMLRLGKRKLRDHPTTTASNAKKLNNLNNQTPNQRTSRTTPQSLLTAAIGRSPTPATINANVQGKGFYLVSDAFLEQLHCQTPGPAFPFEVYHPAHISDSSRDKIDLLEVLQNGRFGTCIYDLLKESKSISKWVWKGLVQKSKNSSHDDYRSLKLIRCGYVGAAKHELPDNINEASVYVCDVLNHLGYSKYMINRRRDVYREKDEIFNMRNRKPVILNTTGSKWEGFSAPFESDYDMMTLHTDIMCGLPDDFPRILPHINTWATMDGEHCHPGHYTLELTYNGTIINELIHAALSFHNNGRIYISSEKYKNVACISLKEHSVSGPAFTFSNEFNSRDAVVALPCISQEHLLYEWIKRPRHHNWPPPELILEISKLPAYLVPVGCKNSENKHMEWRVCFIGESKLVTSFTESQYKLYIILKFLNKHELKPICNELSSYIMKNIVFWLIESNSTDSSSTGNLFDILLSSLHMLRKAIIENHLSYYLIPGRNLLIGRIKPAHQQQLIAKLDELIQEGPRVILRCPKVFAALLMSQTELTEKGRRRDELERLWLEMEHMDWTRLRSGGLNQLAALDQREFSIIERLSDLALPMWRSSSKNVFPEIWYRTIAEILS